MYHLLNEDNLTDRNIGITNISDIKQSNTQSYIMYHLLNEDNLTDRNIGITNISDIKQSNTQSYIMYHLLNEDNLKYINLFAPYLQTCCSKYRQLLHSYPN